MEPDKLLAPFFFVIVCLIAGALLKAVLKKTPLPYSVGLFVFGIILGALDRTGVLAFWELLGTSVHYAGDMNPDLILYIFLPVLIFDAAYELDAHVFRKTLTNATLLSVPGVVIAMFLTAALLMGIERLFPGHVGWTWTFALMFGALISATDPVAVVALLKELKTSKRFSTLVDAESMLNDGTGIVLFMLFFGVYTSQGAPGSPVLDFIFVVAGGVLLGVLLAALCIAFVNKVKADVLVQASIIIMAAYLTFLLAQDYLNVSGVIALVGFGLTVTYYGGVRLSPKVNRFMQEFWELAAYIANTLIFILVGIVIAVKVDFTLLDVAFLLVVYIGINLIRMIMVALFYPFMARSGYGISKREAVILTWGGLRGALGLTLALMVSYTVSIPETIRGHILFLTAGIVTLTLLINATTMRWLLNKLGLTRTSSAKLLLNEGVNRRLEENAKRYIGELKEKESFRRADWGVVESFLPPEISVSRTSVPLHDVAADIRLRVLDKEKSVCWDLFSEGVISSVTMRRLNYMIDELYDKNGNVPLTGKGDILTIPRHSRVMATLLKVGLVKKWLKGYYLEKWIAGYDLAEGFIPMQEAALKLVEEFGAVEISSDKKDALQMLKTELNQNITDGRAYISRLAKDFPYSYGRAVTGRAVRMMLVREKRDIEMFLRQGMITPDDAREMIDNLEQKGSKSVHF